MFFYTTIILFILSNILYPYSEGLLNTSAWVAKITMPIGSDNFPDNKQNTKINQALFMYGWLSNVPILNSILTLSYMATAFVHTWWFGIIMIIVGAIGRVIINARFKKNASYFLFFLYQKLQNRLANYNKVGDNDRADAIKEISKDLEEIIIIYQNTYIKTPTEDIIKANPNGDLYFLYNLYK
jgi:hypothetical protein